MDSFFYIVNFAVFFSLVVIMLVLRRALKKRLEAIEKKCAWARMRDSMQRPIPAFDSVYIPE